MEAVTVVFMTLSVFVFIPILIGLSIKDMIDTANRRKYPGNKFPPQKTG